jgi:hypothetical protein
MGYAVRQPFRRASNTSHLVRMFSSGYGVNTP